MSTFRFSEPKGPVELIREPVSVGRPFLPIFSNDFFSKAPGPIIIIVHIYLLGEEKIVQMVAVC